MITFLKSDIFTAKTEAIVNPVNCVGRMGAGIAKGFKEKYPDVFTAYEEDCLVGKYQPGCVIAYKQTSTTELPYYVICFVTKNHWEHPSKLSYIERALPRLVEIIEINKIPSIAIPKLGCGLGKLNWDDVKPLMIEALEPLNCDVFIYE